MLHPRRCIDGFQHDFPVVEDHPPATGEGTSKRMAEQAAAEAFLRREGMLGERPQ